MPKQRTDLPTKLEGHIERVALHNAIVIVQKVGAHERADKLKVEGESVRRIIIKPVKGRVSYFVALHELGHHLAPRPKTRLEQEVVAWRWALDNCVELPTPGVWKMIARCLDSYEARAERWLSMKLPPADHDFWTLKAEARANR